MTEYDLAIIGGGSAGLTAATVAGKVGAKVVLIEKENLGGDCLHYGCVPSKALIKCAKIARTVENSQKYGIKSQKPEINFQKVMEYVKGAIEQIGVHDSVEAMESKGVEVLIGSARFLSPFEIQVGKKIIKARQTIIATGSQAVAPPIPGLEKSGFINHVGLFELKIKSLPKRILVIGGGPVGVEMGQALSRLGSKVTILQSGPTILPKDDQEISAILTNSLRDELDIYCNANIKSVETISGEKRVYFEKNGTNLQINCDEIFVAAGRKPSLEGLGLKAGKVNSNDRGIIVDETLRTSAKNIWACGDCAGSYQFTHFAEAQARVAVRNALFMGTKKFKPLAVPWITFTDPELAHVGLVSCGDQDPALTTFTYRFPYENLDRAVCDGETTGIAKITCDSKGLIIGATLLGPSSGESLSEIVVAMEEKIPLSRLTSYIHPYPTLNRIVRRLGDQRFLDQGISKWTVALFGCFTVKPSSDKEKL